MSTTATLESQSTDVPDERSLDYRALHTGAITGLVLGIASAFTLVTASSSLEWSLTVAPIPLAGIFFSLRALTQINRHNDQFTGKTVARIGLALSAFFLISSVGYATFVRATEVPEGYQRISFGTMKPSKVDELGGKVVPDEIADLEGQQVFIKGYIRPDSLTVRKNAKRFLLVRDSNACCFGDLSKVMYYDQILVAMQDGLSVDYSSGVFRMGGKLHVHPENLQRGPGWPVFSLEADYVN